MNICGWRFKRRSGNRRRRFGGSVEFFRAVDLWRALPPHPDPLPWGEGEFLSGFQVFLCFGNSSSLRKLGPFEKHQRRVIFRTLAMSLVAVSGCLISRAVAVCCHLIFSLLPSRVTFLILLSSSFADVPRDLMFTPVVGLPRTMA